MRHQRTYRCKDCHDTGLISIWAASTVKLVLAARARGEAKVKPIELKTEVAACTCTAGDKHTFNMVRSGKDYVHRDHCARFGAKWYHVRLGFYDRRTAMHCIWNPFIDCEGLHGEKNQI